VEPEDAPRNESAFREMLEILDRMSSTMFRLTADQMDKIDLSPNRFNALRALGSDEQMMMMSALAERLKVSTAAVTSIVDKLEDEHLVHRTRSKEDRRQVLVQITPRGREAVQRVLDARTDFIRYMFDNVSPEMQQHWLELNREIEKLLERRVAGLERGTESAS
jgi:DNA-binding MarR family transcriptional regulator